MHRSGRALGAVFARRFFLLVLAAAAGFTPAAAGPATQLVVVLPGQELQPGVGIVGSPQPQPPRTPFFVRVYAVDPFFNIDAAYGGPIAGIRTDEAAPTQGRRLAVSISGSGAATSIPNLDLLLSLMGSEERRIQAPGPLNTPQDICMAIENGVKQSPPQVMITWGSHLEFKCVLESFYVRYTLFLDDGTPVRAVMNASPKTFSVRVNPTFGSAPLLRLGVQSPSPIPTEPAEHVARQVVPPLPGDDRFTRGTAHFEIEDVSDLFGRPNVTIQVDQGGGPPLPVFTTPFQVTASQLAVRQVELDDDDDDGTIDRAVVSFTERLNVSTLPPAAEFRLRYSPSGGPVIDRPGLQVIHQAAQDADYSYPLSKLVVDFGAGIPTTSVKYVAFEILPGAGGIQSADTGALLDVAASNAALSIDRAGPVVTGALYQDLDMDFMTDSLHLTYSEEVSFREGAGVSVTAPDIDPLLEIPDPSEIRIGGAGGMDQVVSLAPASGAGAIAAEIQTKVRSISVAGGTELRSALAHFTATFDVSTRRFVLRSGASGAASTVSVLPTGTPDDAAPLLGLGPANGGIEKPGSSAGIADLDDWVVLSADGRFNLLEGLNPSGIMITGNTIVVTLPIEAAAGTTPKFFFRDALDGGFIADLSAFANPAVAANNLGLAPAFDPRELIVEAASFHGPDFTLQRSAVAGFVTLDASASVAPLTAAGGPASGPLVWRQVGGPFLFTEMPGDINSVVPMAAGGYEFEVRLHVDPACPSCAAFNPYIDETGLLIRRLTLDVLPGPPARTVVLLPGETLTPGVADFEQAVTGTVLPGTAGTPFQVRVVAVDQFFNPVSPPGTPGLAANFLDPATVTIDPPVFDGNGQFTFTVKDTRAEGPVRFTATSTLPENLPSHPFRIDPGPTASVAIVLPGQTLQTGVPAGIPPLSGTPNTIQVRARFTVQVYAVDAFGNINFSENGSVRLFTDETVPTEGRRFGTVISAEGAPITITAMLDDSIRLSISGRASTPFALGSAASGDEVCAALESAVQGMVQQGVDDPRFACQFLPEFRRYLLVSGAEAEGGDGTPAEVTASVLVDPSIPGMGPFFLDTGSQTSQEAEAYTARDALPPTPLDQRFSRGIAFFEIMHSDPASAGPGRTLRVEADVAPFVFLSSPRDVPAADFTARRAVLEVAAQDDLGINRARVVFSQLIDPSTLPGNEPNFVLEHTDATGTISVPGQSFSLDLVNEFGSLRSRLTIHFGAGIPTTGLGGVRLRILPAAASILSAETIQPLLAGNEPPLIDAAPPVILSTQSRDTNMDGLADQIVFVFSEDVRLGAGSGYSLSRPVQGDPASLTIPSPSSLRLRAGGPVVGFVERTVPVMNLPDPFQPMIGPQDISTRTAIAVARDDPSPPFAHADVAFEPRTQRFILRGGLAGSGQIATVLPSLQPDDLAPALKFGVANGGREAAGVDPGEPRPEAFFLLGPDGRTNLISGIGPQDVTVSGREVTLRLSDQSVPLGSPVTSIAVTDSRVRYSGTESLRISIHPPSGYSSLSLSPLASGFIQIRDNDTIPGDGVITVPAGVVVLDASDSLAPLSAADPPSISGFQWRQLDGPVALAIDDPAALVTQTTGARGGTYRIEAEMQVQPPGSTVPNLFVDGDGTIRREIALSVLCASNSHCDDGNVCNGVETCDAATGACLPGTSLPEGAPTTCGIGGCAATGACTGGLDTCAAGTPSSETCNGVDDDCDGSVDEGFAVLQCGLGSCQRETPSCAGGVPQACNAHPLEVFLERLPRLATGDEPVDMTAADLDGDGHLDIVGTNRLSDDISIRYGDASGAFGPEIRLVAGDAPAAVAVGDLDGDGLIDLVAVNRGSDDLTIFRQSPARVFTNSGPIQTGDAPEDFALGDLDRDGFVDLIVANTGSNTVRVYFGDGTPMPAFGVDLPTGFAPAAVAITRAPLTVVAGNPLGELIVLDRGSDDLRVFTQTAPRVFVQPFPPVATGSRPEAMAVADLDDDGDVDIATANSLSDDLSLFRGRGDGTFDLVATVPTSPDPVDLAALDVDADGRSDIIALSRASNRVSVHLRLEGLEIYDFPGEYVVGSAPRSLAVADVDGDGRPDVVTANGGSDDLSVLLGQSGGRFAPARGIIAVGAPESIAAGDLNGDGRTDVAVPRSVTPGIMDVFLQSAAPGTFDPPIPLPVGRCPADCFIDDLKDKGTSSSFSIVTANRCSNDVSVHLGNGDGTFAPEIRLPAGLAPSAVAAADFDGDARLDVAVSNRDSDNVTVFRQTAPGTFETSPYVVAVGACPTDLVAADLDGDALPDVATVGECSGSISLCYGLGDGTFEPCDSVMLAAAPSSLAVGDVDGDGRADLVASIPSTREVEIRRQTAHRFFAIVDRTQHPAGAPRRVALPDLNRDGLLDIVVANVAPPGMGSVAYSLDAGSSRHVWTVLPAGVFVVGRVAVADLTGDGRLDLAVADLGAGRVHLFDQTAPSTERCDGTDNDCDGAVDEDFATGAACTGAGVCGSGVRECAGPISTRCSTEPGGSQDQSQPEVCNGVDDDCNGSIPSSESDADADGVRICDGDCDDADAGASGVPRPVTGLRVEPPGVLHRFVWDSQADLGPSTVYDGVRVRVTPVDRLPGAFRTGVCAASGLTTPEFDASGSDPGPGEIFQFALRARNRCAIGTYGTPLRDQEIALSPDACRAPSGTACASASDCASGFCADGVCCNAACGGACEACDLPGIAGTCSPRPAGSDPENGCSGFTCDGFGSCRGSCLSDVDCSPRDGCETNLMVCTLRCNVDQDCDEPGEFFCDSPAGFCRPKKPLGDACTLGGECRDGFCADGVCCSDRCDGVCENCSLPTSPGTCAPIPAESDAGICSPYTCDGSRRCRSTCDTDQDCMGGFFCESATGLCRPKRLLGETCLSANECMHPTSPDPALDGFCVDGVCCDEDCSGECRRCNVAGAVGTCANTPRQTPPRSASGCGDYLCGGDGSCLAICADAQDCVAGGQCVSGQCGIPRPNGSTCTIDAGCASQICNDESVCCAAACDGPCRTCASSGAAGTCLDHPAGTVPESGCGGFNCDGAGQCRTTCVDDGECASGNFCDAGVCVPLRADLSVSMSDSPDPVPAEEIWTYTPQILNLGPRPASNTGMIILVDGMPAVSDVLFEATPSQGSCQITGNQAVCSLGTIADGTGATVTVRCLRTVPGTATATVTVTADENDPDPANGTAMETTTIGPSAQPPPFEPVASVCDCAPGYVERGNPSRGVSLATGGVRLQFEDFRIRGATSDIVIARTYDSLDARSGTLGPGWRFSYDIQLEPAGPHRRLLDGDGQRRLYRLQPDGTWSAAGFFRVLAMNADGTHTLTFADRSRWEFLPLDGSPAAGRVASIVDRNQNATTLAYDGAGRLTTIASPEGRTVVLAHDAGGRIATITITDDQIQYGYTYYLSGEMGGSPGDLKSVTTPAVTGTPNGNDFPLGRTVTYTYSSGHADDRLNHNLLSIVDPMGRTVARYVHAATLDHMFDHVTREIGADGVDLSGLDLVYVPQTPGPANDFAVLKVIANDRAGNVSEHLYDTANRLVVLREYTGRAVPDFPTTETLNRPTGQLRPGDPSVHETHNHWHFDSLLTGIDLPNGASLQMSFEADNPVASRLSQGNLVEIRRIAGPAGGNPAQIVETFEHTPGTNFMTRHVDGRGSQTLHTHDPRGNRLRTVHRIPSIVEDFEYDATGRLTARVLPDDGSGHRRRDEFTYHATGPQRGYLRTATRDAGSLALATTYEYDARGNVLRRIDPRGNDRTYVVTPLDEVVREISPETSPGSGVRVTRDIFHDARGDVVRVDVENRDGSGVLQPNTHYTTTNTYDAEGRVTQVTHEVDPAASVAVEYLYDANGNRSRLRFGEAVAGSQPANEVLSLYDERDLLFRHTRAPGDPGQSTVQHDYDGIGNPIRVSAGLEGTPRVSNVLYDGHGRLALRTDPMGNVATFTYDANGNRLSERLDGELNDLPGGSGNIRLSETTRTYDPMDRETQTDASRFVPQTGAPVGDGNARTLRTYGGAGGLLNITDERGNVTTYTYDTAGRARMVTDARGNTTTSVYDAGGNLVQVTEVEKSDIGNPDRMSVTTSAHDGLDRLTQVTTTPATSAPTATTHGGTCWRGSIRAATARS